MNRPIVNGRAQVVVGDITTHGAKVVSGSPTTVWGIENKPIALQRNFFWRGIHYKAATISRLRWFYAKAWAERKVSYQARATTAGVCKQTLQHD